MIRYEGVIVREYYGAPWILWPSWGVWRFSRRAPEMIAFRDIDVHALSC